MSARPRLQERAAQRRADVDCRACARRAGALRSKERRRGAERGSNVNREGPAMFIRPGTCGRSSEMGPCDLRAC